MAKLFVMFLGFTFVLISSVNSYGYIDCRSESSPGVHVNFGIGTDLEDGFLLSYSGSTDSRLGDVHGSLDVEEKHIIKKNKKKELTYKNIKQVTGTGIQFPADPIKGTLNVEKLKRGVFTFQVEGEADVVIDDLTCTIEADF